MEKSRGKSHIAFQGRVLTVRVDPVEAKSGPTTREVVERRPAVGIVAETPDQRVVVIRQFRWPVQDTLWELPAGLIDAGEEPVQAAARELAEETGYRAQHWQLLHHYYSSPGFTTEEIYLFSASDLTEGDCRPDSDEEIERDLWDADQVRRALANGDVRNGIALIGLYWWLSGRKRG
ncbi:NUDIX hydrolase [Sulfobacillus acidophilus TPY]|uniref:NUDIX hydrolase n=1 Tax=Sulfobacillus acidophilus (strain ATCC 700253 / DSM 10332 / NAL) TaxID=679936 RepID=G8TYW0_SULAD|nr:NUDIX hydrolase [Sulfobacillus acidophilus TPY]AEW05139.1 NUDIX hydrolase [Sulfobacillus acidophilus DSM 10332]